ncbi:CDP-alcohol phosphatidyltransferase family protein [Desulforhopalus sp. IMCC35007]|uniref:CDP-alcohol phosphatidyltransferase family protein n=1 Tax=Desulforhopalus sp. IMCC35007 TaxID=2569543 RepID=UPI0010ADBFAE|nr:CDP-alcohol phosphatidyltransferase family protein [Desulforhopalus sp. IMCC35007]TKB06113.1 CDP-alcohol phosphatidyltransferase family protein [Desulforhopalus sp. IMCC35007]
MKKLPDASSDNGRNYFAGNRDQGEVLRGLRRQSRWAAFLLIFPWLFTLFYCQTIFYKEPFALLALLPGLATLVHIHWHLVHHLKSNHRQLEENNLFATLGAANWITLVRASFVVALAGFLPLSLMPHGLVSQNTLAWGGGTIYLVVSILDLFDGYVARRQRRETELGKQLDIVTDAAGLLVASLLAVALGRLPGIYLLVGLAYYPFIFGIWLRRRQALPLVDLQPRPYSRIIAGCQMGLVAMALLPIFKPVFTFLAAYLFMIPLLIGFLRDWLVVSCRIQTNADQQSGLDLWMRSLAGKPLPLVIRLVVFTGGIATLAAHGGFQTHLFWQLAHSLSCLLIVLGFMGRSAGLFLVLLLGSNLSPFGVNVLSMTLFAAAASLILTGTGTMSLWGPEEAILYRRSKKNANTACEGQ